MKLSIALAMLAVIISCCTALQIDVVGKKTIIRPIISSKPKLLEDPSTTTIADVKAYLRENHLKEVVIAVNETIAGTDAPTSPPTDAPTAAPTNAPTSAPTNAPTAAPTYAPTAAPTDAPEPTLTGLDCGTYTFAYDGGKSFDRYWHWPWYYFDATEYTVQKCGDLCNSTQGCESFVYEEYTTGHQFVGSSWCYLYYESATTCLTACENTSVTQICDREKRNGHNSWPVACGEGGQAGGNYGFYESTQMCDREYLRLSSTARPTNSPCVVQSWTTHTSDVGWQAKYITCSV